jgi:hypothetical protein
MKIGLWHVHADNNYGTIEAVQYEMYKVQGAR